MKKEHQRKLRNIFLKKELQGKLTFQYFLLTILAVLIFSLILAYLSSGFMTISYEHSHLTVGQTPSMLVKTLFRAHWLFLLVAGTLVALVSIWLTHRIAGPIYRFEQVLDKMIRKDFRQRIHLRPKDEGMLLAERINAFNDSLSSDLLEIRHRCEQMEKCLKSLDAETAYEEEFPPGPLKEVEEQNSRIIKLLSDYKLDEKIADQRKFPSGLLDKTEEKSSQLTKILVDEGKIPYSPLEEIREQNSQTIKIQVDDKFGSGDQC